jgi:phosphatidylglycerol:prolipoprotein diacylglycerol transferase
VRQILFEIFGVAFPSWFVFFFLAMAALYLTAVSLARLLPDKRVAMSAPVLFVSAYISGWFGARLLSLLAEDGSPFLGASDFFLRLFSFGGMTFYGGALGAAITLFTLAALRRLPAKSIFDIGMISGLVALGIGRVGCFLNGCDYGRTLPVHHETAPWWAHENRVLHDAAARYPTQLEESLFSLALAAAAAALYRRAMLTPSRGIRPGLVGAWLLLLSAGHRFLNEMFRDDPRGLFPGTTLPTSQGIALVLVMVALLLLILWRRDSRTTNS